MEVGKRTFARDDRYPGKAVALYTACLVAQDLLDVLTVGVLDQCWKF